MTKIAVACKIVLFTGLFPTFLFAQQILTCRVLETKPGLGYVVEVDSQQYLLISEEVERNLLKMKANLNLCRKEVAAKDSLIEILNRSLIQSDSARIKLQDYTSELEKTLEQYKKLYADLKKTVQPRYLWQVGLGFTGSQTKPAILTGLQVYRLHLWALIQESNFGMLVGTHFRFF